MGGIYQVIIEDVHILLKRCDYTVKLSIINMIFRICHHGKKQIPTVHVGCENIIQQSISETLEDDFYRINCINRLRERHIL